MSWGRGLCAAISGIFISAQVSAQALPPPAPYCDGYDRWSVAGAYNLAIEGLAIFESVPDCYGDNWYVCDEANKRFWASVDHLTQVHQGRAIGRAITTGEECLTCNLGQMIEIAEGLQQMEGALYNRGFNSDVGTAWRTLITWQNVTECAVIDALNTPPPPPPPPSPPVVSGGGGAWWGGSGGSGGGGGSSYPPGCENVSKVANAGLPNYNHSTLSNISLDNCLNECRRNAWCKSADYHRDGKTCYLQKVNSSDVPLKYDYGGNPYDHYYCTGR